MSDLLEFKITNFEVGFLRVIWQYSTFQRVLKCVLFAALPEFIIVGGFYSTNRSLLLVDCRKIHTYYCSIN